ncbi:MAG: hypothetical protein POELPBGB_00798 [Bacteroidia bacterium]|nr:hypothetical protein [Bacteroidia bacterium]
MTELIITSKEDLQLLIQASVKKAFEEYKHHSEPDDAFLNAQEAADFIKRSINSLYRYTSNGQIPFIKRNGKNLTFRKSELKKWLLEGKQKSIAEIEQELGRKS